MVVLGMTLESQMVVLGMNTRVPNGCPWYDP